MRGRVRGALLGAVADENVPRRHPQHRRDRCLNQRFDRGRHEILIPRQQPFEVDNFRLTLTLGHGVHPSPVGDVKHHQHAMNLQHTISSGFLRSQPSTARAVCHSSENNSLSFAAAEGSASKPFSSQAASDFCQATYHRRAAATSRARRRFSASKPRLRVEDPAPCPRRAVMGSAAPHADAVLNDLETRTR